MDSLVAERSARATSKGRADEARQAAKTISRDYGVRARLLGCVSATGGGEAPDWDPASRRRDVCTAAREAQRVIDLPESSSSAAMTSSRWLFWLLIPACAFQAT